MRSDSDTTVAPTATNRIDNTFRFGRIGLVVLLAVALLGFPLLGVNSFIMSVAVVVMSYACFATGWNFSGGFTGYMSLGHASYTGLGGYATALLMLRLDVHPWLALLIGALGVAVLSIPIGFASLRVRGASYVIVSIALVLILLLVFQSWSSVTGGSNGLRVPRPFGPEVLRPEQHVLFYYLHIALLVVMLALWWAIDRSRFGAGLRAIREDEDKAQSLDIATFAYKLGVYVISAFFTAVAGGLYALWFGFLDPIFQFSILIGSYMVLMSLLGGIRSLFGPVLGAIVVGVGLEFFKAQYGDTQFHLVALGLLLVIVVLVMPEGVIPTVAQQLNRLRPTATSIREETAEELAERRRSQAAQDSSEISGVDTTTSGGAR